MDIEDISKILESNRLRIIDLIKKNREMTPTELKEYFVTSGSNITQHLKYLESKKIINCKKDGQNRIYSINQKGLDELNQSILKYFSGGFDIQKRNNQPEEEQFEEENYEF